MQTNRGLELLRWFRHWTFWPKRMHSGKLIWCSYYYECRVYCDAEGIKPIRKPFWSYYYSEPEYTLQILKGKTDESIQKDIQQNKRENRIRWFKNIHSRRDRGFGGGSKPS